MFKLLFLLQMKRHFLYYCASQNKTITSLLTVWLFCSRVSFNWFLEKSTNHLFQQKHNLVWLRESDKRDNGRDNLKIMGLQFTCNSRAISGRIQLGLYCLPLVFSWWRLHHVSPETWLNQVFLISNFLNGQWHMPLFPPLASNRAHCCWQQ